MKTGYQEMTEYRNVTYRELAEIIYNNPDEGVGFTLETCEDFEGYGEPTGWHGAKLVNPFDSSYGVLLIDYYGGYDCKAFPLFNEIEKADSIDPFSQQITPDDIIRHISKLIMKYVFCQEDYDSSTVCTDWPAPKTQEPDDSDTAIVLHDMVNWHAYGFFPKEEKIVRDLILSGKNFSVGGNAAKTDLYVEISAYKDDMRCSVIKGTDSFEDMIDAAMQEINGKSMRDLSDVQLYTVLNSLEIFDIHTEVISAVTIPRTSTFEYVKQALAEEEMIAKEIWHKEAEKVKSTIQRVLGFADNKPKEKKHDLNISFSIDQIGDNIECAAYQSRNVQVSMIEDAVADIGSPVALTDKQLDRVLKQLDYDGIMTDDAESLIYLSRTATAGEVRDALIEAFEDTCGEIIRNYNRTKEIVRAVIGLKGE